jgi:SPP1 gp7 family putative phage head morphogenesis protein
MATVHTPVGGIYDAAAANMDALLTGNTAAADQLVTAWGKSRSAIRADMDKLYARIAEAQAAGQPVGPAVLYQRDRLKAALKTVDREVGAYSAFVSDTVAKQQKSAIMAASKHAAQLAQQAIAENATGLSRSFLDVNPENMKHLVGFLSDGSPLGALLDGLGPTMSSQIRSTLITGLARGKGMDYMARQIDQTLDMPRWRALRILRTETLRVYRDTTRATYLANAGILSGWVWHAKLDARTCLSCVVMHGTEHPPGDILDGHPHCRCAMVPRTASWEEITGTKGLPDTRPDLPSGKAWLEAQPPHIQRAMMGPGRFKLWRSGQASLDDMVARTFDPAWGTMRRERTITEILNGTNSNFGGQVAKTGVAAEKAPRPVVAQEYADRWTAQQLDELADAATGQDAMDLRAAAVINRETAKLNRVLDRAPAN